MIRNGWAEFITQQINPDGERDADERHGGETEHQPHEGVVQQADLRAWGDTIIL